MMGSIVRRISALPIILVSFAIPLPAAKQQSSHKLSSPLRRSAQSSGNFQFMADAQFDGFVNAGNTYV